MKMQVLFLVTLVSLFFLSTTVGQPVDQPINIEAIDTSSSDLIPCVKMSLLLESCWNLGADLPNCNGKSHLQLCAEYALKNASQCKNELVTRFLSSTQQNYLNSDKILCQNELYKQFLSDLDCWVWSRLTAGKLVYLTKGFFTSDGCKAIYLNVELLKMVVGPKCGALMAKYVDPLFKMTPCGSTELPNKLESNEI